MREEEEGGGDGEKDGGSVGWSLDPNKKELREMAGEKGSASLLTAPVTFTSNERLHARCVLGSVWLCKPSFWLHLTSFAYKCIILLRWE
jgi:hypothetical protein